MIVMKRLSFIACIAMMVAGCSGGSDSKSSTEQIDLKQRNEVLLSTGMIYYGHDPEEAFDDMYYAFVADEKEMAEASAKALADFKTKVAALSKEDRAFLKGVYSDYADLADMANYAYKDSDVKLPKGWTDLGAKDAKLAAIIDKYSVSGFLPTGLKCSLMAKGDRQALVFAGTDFPASWTNPKQVMDFIIDAYEDVDGAMNDEATQFVLACRLVDELIDNGYVNVDNLEFAGHSLGGRLASEMAVQYGCPAVLFNAAGVSPEIYDNYDKARKAAGNDWRCYIVDVIAANDPLTCGLKYMSGESDPFVSTAANALSMDKGALDGILSLAGAVVGNLAGDSMKGLTDAFGGLVDEYYDRDYRALGAKMPIREDMAGHGVTELAAALRNRAVMCD